MSMPSGWYPDAHGKPIEHFWSGAHWSGDTRPAQGTPTMPASYFTDQQDPFANGRLPHLPPAVAKTRAWYQRPGVLVAAGLVLALLLIAGVGGALTQPKKSDAGRSVPLPTTTTQGTPPPAPETSAAPTKQSVSRRAPVRKPAVRTRSHQAPPAAAGSFVMPDEVGKDLQAAQDDVQRVSGDPVFFSHSHDLVDDRFQILDRDWQVCTQNVDAGTRVSAIAHVDFGVVKAYESCP